MRPIGVSKGCDPETLKRIMTQAIQRMMKNCICCGAPRNDLTKCSDCGE